MAITLKNIREFIEVQNFSDPFGVDVGPTSTLILPERPNRKWAIFCNDSTEDVYLAIGKPAQIDKGIRLTPGAVFEINWSNLTTKAVYGISISGYRTVSGQEGW